MAALQRILIRTHHMTSRKKILTITKAAKRFSCAVVLKTGGPPGVMLAEGEGAGEWLEVVRKLRYKDYHLLRREDVKARGMAIEPGSVVELTTMKDLGAFLEGSREMHTWWRVHMGYTKGDDSP
ncbi:hypothetical protein PZA11_000028 [Diplocarpon coronariae]|uniref:Uncharacterized protein n=1 Tax=Diplocarpon coronariae TaxID=2795749 RepID=A0A218YXR7_9HELO|nr:hypothetical protein JHW43_002409 [Diplocarpon mali]OWP00599.1 hypothetical protein B2J93_6036 [Marssonina coronariae]